MEMSNIETIKRYLLIVDDEENIVFALKRVLRADGYKIFIANSGEEGLCILQSHPIGVIISDQRMPEMTGSVFLSKVKDLYPDTVRIMLSGYTELESVTDAINRGAIYRFLTKPWDVDLLRKNVAEAFTYHELRSVNKNLTKELKIACKKLEQNNQELEQRVEKKTRQIRINSRILQLSRDILEDLPVGVIGIAGNLQIAVANKKSIELLCKTEEGIIGRFTNDVFDSYTQSLIKKLIKEKNTDSKKCYSTKNLTNIDITLSFKIDFTDDNPDRIMVLLWRAGEYENAETRRNRSI